MYRYGHHVLPETTGEEQEEILLNIRWSLLFYEYVFLSQENLYLTDICISDIFFL